MAQHNMSSPPGHIDSMSVSMSQPNYTMPYHPMQVRGPGQGQYPPNRLYYNPAMGPHIRGHPQELGSPPHRILTSPPLSVRPIMQQQQHPVQGQQVVFQQAAGQQVTYVATPSGQQQQIITMQGGQMKQFMAPPTAQFHISPGTILMRQTSQAQMPPGPSYQPQAVIMQQQPQMIQQQQPRVMQVPSSQQSPLVLGHPPAHQITYAVAPGVQQPPPGLLNRPPNPYAPQTQQPHAQAPTHTPAAESTRLLEKRRLEDLVKEVDPSEQLDEDVKDALLQLTDDFVDRLIADSCRMAKHRKSSSLDVKDVKLVLEEPHPPKKAFATEAHKQRMAVIKKSLKKA